MQKSSTVSVSAGQICNASQNTENWWCTFLFGSNFSTCCTSAKQKNWEYWILLQMVRYGPDWSWSDTNLMITFTDHLILSLLFAFECFTFKLCLKLIMSGFGRHRNLYVSIRQTHSQEKTNSHSERNLEEKTNWQTSSQPCWPTSCHTNRETEKWKSVNVQIN